MEIRTFSVQEQTLELFKLLKLENLVASGGEAKFVIAEGQVLVNGEVEYRKRRKLLAGDIVEFRNFQIRLETSGE